MLRALRKRVARKKKISDRSKNRRINEAKDIIDARTFLSVRADSRKNREERKARVESGGSELEGRGDGRAEKKLRVIGGWVKAFLTRLA